MDSVYEKYKVYGPYVRKQDGRKIMRLKHIYGHNLTIAYARYLMEQKIGRQLIEDEQVHHKDGDLTNDALDNLTIVLGSDHTRGHATKYTESETVECAWCHVGVILTPLQLRKRHGNRNRNK